MSIISDALKKAREARAKDERLPLSSRPLTPQEIRRASSSRSRAPWFAAAVFAAAALPLLLPLAARHLHTSAGRQPEGPVTSRAQFSIEERPLFMVSGKPEFSLSGIAQFQESYMAVVNGQILRTGDVIHGAKVTAITMNSVELEYRGERIVLEKSF